VASLDEASTPKGPSLVVQLAMLAAMTVAALGVGWLSGSYLKSTEAPAKPVAKAEAPGKSGLVADGMTLVDLAPITTNLAAPSETWVRLDASLLLDAPQPARTVEAIHQDLLAFIRTVKMHQVEGASGYQHLRDDLQERAAIRSEGHVKGVLIRTLVFE
jgi:flagellar FliL protein